MVMSEELYDCRQRAVNGTLARVISGAYPCSFKRLS